MLNISLQATADEAVLKVTAGTPSALLVDASVNPDSDGSSSVTSTASAAQTRNTRGRRARRVSARRRGGSGVATSTPARDKAQPYRTSTGSTRGVSTRSCKGVT